jgi:hypothetical protein
LLLAGIAGSEACAGLPALSRSRTRRRPCCDVTAPRSAATDTAPNAGALHQCMRLRDHAG